MKKILKRLFALLVVFAVVVIGWSSLENSIEAIKYRTATVSLGSITEVVTADGTLNPIQLVNVGTQTSGQISKIYVQVNDQVTQGQLLAEIDPALLEAALRQSKSSMDSARVAYEQAERDLNRTRQLVEKDYLPKVDLEKAQQAELSAKNSYDSAKSQVERAQIDLNYAKIFSPIDGVVISQDVTLGQTVAAQYQTPNMFKIAGDLTQMKIDVNFSEADISKIKAGMPVTFTVDAFPDRVFAGTVQMVNFNPTNTSGVVTYSATVTVKNEDKALLPGMTAYVKVTLSEVKDVLRVPLSALRFTPPPQEVSGLQRLFQPSLRGSRGGMRMPPMFTVGTTGNDNKGTIYLLKNDQLTSVDVTIGKSDDTNVAVSGEGLADGDTVVTGLMPQSKR